MNPDSRPIPLQTTATMGIRLCAAGHPDLPCVAVGHTTRRRLYRLYPA